MRALIKSCVMVIGFCMVIIGYTFASVSYADWNGGYSSKSHGHHNRSYDWVDKRQGVQNHRIAKGERKGLLTPNEVRFLDHQQKKIANLERRFERDGFLSRYERVVLDKKLDNANRSINRLMQNDQYYRKHAYGSKGYHDKWDNQHGRHDRAGYYAHYR